MIAMSAARPVEPDHDAGDAIITEALSREFNGRPALDRLTLRVPAGIVFGLLGPNGAGKTTTIRLLLGLLEPTSGTARVFGLDPNTAGNAIRAQAGALLEHSGLYERLTAADNLEFYGRVWGIPRAERCARMEELLSPLALWERRHDTVATWSRGMKQKLAIARALFHRPRLVFLDEPTAGLDPVAAAALRDDLLALVARERVTVFLTTHNLAEAEKLCAQVAILRAGRLLAVGTPSEVRSRSARPFVTVNGRRLDGEVLRAIREAPHVESAVVSDGARLLSVDLTPGADVASLVRLIVTRGGEVEGVRRGEASLEDAFHALMKEEP